MALEIASAKERRFALRPQGFVFVALGLVIAIVPKAIYDAYEAMPGMAMKCLATANAEIALGAALAALGVVYFFFAKTARAKLGISIGAAALGALSLLLPTNWTGLCADLMMPCNMVTLPALIVADALVFAAAGIGIGVSAKALKALKNR